MQSSRIAFMAIVHDHIKEKITNRIEMAHATHPHPAVGVSAWGLSAVHWEEAGHLCLLHSSPCQAEHSKHWGGSMALHPGMLAGPAGRLMWVLQKNLAWAWPSYWILWLMPGRERVAAGHKSCEPLVVFWQGRLKIIGRHQCPSKTLHPLSS